MKKESKGKGLKKYRTLIILLILAGIGILFYFYSTTKSSAAKRNTNVEISEVTKLLSKDLDNSYPDTPREVIRTYNRIITCFYGAKITEEELNKLAKMAQTLMDNELLERNPYDVYYNNLKEDIAAYKSEKKTISSFILANSYDVQYKTLQGKQYAMLDCVYYTKSNAGTSRTIQRYTLRKDEAGRWKILYWSLVENEKDE